MKKRISSPAPSPVPSGRVPKKPLFLVPTKKILYDVVVYSFINFLLIYGWLFFTSDMSIAMVSVIWVGIIAWRGGIKAGLLACNFIYLSTFFALHFPPHANIKMAYYFDNKIPGFIIGLLQCLTVCTVVGYISNLFHQLHEEVKLRKKIQVELEQKIEELDAFGHTVAHDLKNPLMAINMATDALRKDFESSNDVKIKKKLSFINDGTTNMVNIIESILLLAGIKKIDPGQIAVFPVAQSVDEALRRLEHSIKLVGAQITKPDSWPSAIGYAPWITEVWVNYISNALKYGGNPAQQIKPLIELRYDRLAPSGSADREDHIRFWVRDNGEGIAREKSGVLFREFSRLHKDKEGHGLGLSISKTIIDRFNGAVGVETDIGKGSLFYFTLPVTNPKNG